MKNKLTAFSKRTNLVLLIGILLSAVLSGLYYVYLQRQEKTNIARISTIYAERTENLINGIFHKTDVLAAAVKLENGDITEPVFETVAQLVYEKDSGIRGIQYMPGAVVTYSYPLEGNEGVMGKNFLEIPERRADVLLAISTKSIALSGPYNLIQGGLGVVARNPVFLTDASGKEYFWGFSTIVLDLPDALTSAGLDHLSEEGYDFQLFCVNENNERLVIAGNPQLNVSEAVSGTIQVPHHTWTLAISGLHPWVNPLKAAAACSICFLLTFILWRLICSLVREKEAIEAKDRFFSNISHDMRTPLNAVLGFTALAEAPGIPEADKNAYLTKIQSSGELLLELVNDTLTLSKANNGKIQLHPVPCSTEELGRSFLPMAAELAERKGVHFTVDKTGYRSRTILVDRLNAEKIFLNILTNAIKYTPSGGHVSASVKDDPADAPDPDLVFVIKDDGIGMSEEFLTHLYEPFAQKNRPGYESGGTGLGLAIVKQLVSLMGGQIRIESRKDQGTTVTLRLHFPETDAPAVPLKETRESVSLDVLAGKRVLLCEDNALNREIGTALLKNRGMEVSLAENGQATVQIFSDSAENTFDVILMDLRMPVMDGLEATRRIRQAERADAASVPIIAITADAFEEDIQRCLKAGMNGHLAKPVIPEKLYETLTVMLSKPHV